MSDRRRADWSRRQFVGAALVGSGMAISCGGGGSAPPAPPPAPPPSPPAQPLNVLFLLVDDQRNDTLGCAGHPVVRTPNLDALASQGTRFANAFVTTSICAASRASIITGTFERTHQFTFEAPPLKDAWCATSYPTLMRAAGYRTGFIGKFGMEVSPAALGQMFDSFRPHNRTPYFNVLPDGTRIHETDLTAQRAIEFLREQPVNQPFCLNLSFNAPHAEDGDLANLYPWPPSADGLYGGTPIPPARLNEPELFDSLPSFLKTSLNRERFFWCCDAPDKYAQNMRAYFRMISGIDNAVGRVMAELERLGLAGNTLVVYTADNGYYMGDRGFAGKWSHFEQSLRVPLIIRDPRAPQALRGQTDRGMALNIDIAPTLLAAAGLAAPARSQGTSLLNTVRGTASGGQRSEGFFEHLWATPSIPRWDGIRTTRYKYARYFAQQPVFEFLYDLEIDPDERTNLAGVPAYAATLTQLRERTLALGRQYEQARLT